MKNATKIVAVLLVLFTLFGCFVGCVKDTNVYDPEKRPFTMSIGALDGNFNPFFYTAQNDGNVIGMTQVSMLASDAEGNPVCGENRPTVAKDFTVTEATDKSSTTYEFLIKNGMKFSDGQDLNVMDVLFNLYVYLDEAYIGSNTLYSTDIKGLNAYHTQELGKLDTEENDTYKTFLAEANQRVLNLVDFCNGDIDADEQITKDALTVINLFKDEVKSDWTSIENSFASRDEKTYEYRFTETWQAYLFNEGIVHIVTETNENGAQVPKKDENGKYYTTLDEDDTYQTELDAYVTDSDNIAKYTASGSTAEQAKEFLTRDWAIDFVFSAMTGFESVNDQITTLQGQSWNKTKVAEIAQFWATADKALAQFVSEARTAFYADKIKDGLTVPTVSGITVSRVTSFNGKELGEKHDVLSIVINDVDPKAIWNFSISISPMHYYSTPALTEEADADYKAYLDADAQGKEYTLTKFGVKFADADFFGEGGLQAGDKNRLPVGAGAYKASTANGGAGTAGQFHANKVVYYERNTYFETMGAELKNAVIKSVRYAEIGDDKVITALINKEIDYGMPSGNVNNAARIATASDYLGSAKYSSNGYGYVGVNPKFVPNILVRRAIMKAMDTASTVNNYYQGDWAEVIYRPMSKNSWAYPHDAEEYPSIASTSQTNDITALLIEAGYTTIVDGVRQNSAGEKLKFTFTIAGSSTEHPAYKMFTEAEKLLEDCGMDITVATDIQALKKLASGNLAVWAAAWSSSIDPDMYQVYHKDSKATSVKNWNYPEIIADTTGKFATEQGIIDDLSDLIDEARKTTVRAEREELYATALDLIMDLAVELPTYQRRDYEVYNKQVIDSQSLTATPSAFAPLFDRLWEVSYN